MKNHLLIACVVLFACAISATVIASASTTDLDLDTTFGANGSVIGDFNAGSSNHDVGLRSFTACVRTGTLCNFPVVLTHYIVGYHPDSGHYDALVELVDDNGSPVTGFGTGGHKTVPTTMVDIRDVAFDPATNRLYFVGAQFGVAGEDFAVTCVDIATGATCAGFGDANGTKLISFDLGANNNDVATRVLFDPAQGFLYVAGFSVSSNGEEISVAKLAVANGALVNTFGIGGRAHYDIGGRPTGTALTVAAIALLPGQLLYLGGTYLQDNDAYDGYVFAFSAFFGNSTHLQTISNGNPPFPLYEDVSISALTVLANGKVAMAGSAGIRGANAPELLLARSSATLVPDTGFCGTGICVKPVSAGPHGWQNTLPTAIAERPNNRDLVIGIQAGTWTFNFVTNQWILSQKQVVRQYAASGGALHAEQQIDFRSASGVTPTAYAFGMSVDNYTVELTGTRLWSTTSDDMDMTLTRLLANDTIFADQFGGPHSD